MHGALQRLLVGTVLCYIALKQSTLEILESCPLILQVRTLICLSPSELIGSSNLV